MDKNRVGVKGCDFRGTYCPYFRMYFNNMNPTVSIGTFLRQTFIQKNFTSFQVQNPFVLEEELLMRVRSALSMNETRPGYRDGVILAKINPLGFKLRVRELVDGDHLFGEFKGRIDGEAPRKKAKVLHVGELPAAKFVDAVLYSKETLAEDGQKIETDYEIVAFLAKATDEDEPMEPDTLIANHFKFDGGTDTKMSPEQFEQALRKSVEFWKNRAHIY